MAALIVNLTWIQVVDARALQNHAANTRNLAEQARADRGSILTRDGVVLAESEQVARGTYERVYPKHELRRPHRRLLQHALRPSRHRGRRERRARRRQARLRDLGRRGRRRGRALGARQRRRAHDRQPRAEGRREGARRAQRRVRRARPPHRRGSRRRREPRLRPRHDRPELGRAEHRPERPAGGPLAQRALRAGLHVQGRDAHRRARHRRRDARPTRSPVPAR